MSFQHVVASLNITLLVRPTYIFPRHLSAIYTIDNSVFSAQCTWYSLSIHNLPHTPLYTIVTFLHATLVVIVSTFHLFIAPKILFREKNFPDRSEIPSFCFSPRSVLFRTHTTSTRLLISAVLNPLLLLGIAFLFSGVYVGRRSNSSANMRRAAPTSEQQLSPYCFLLACHYSRAKRTTAECVVAPHTRDTVRGNLRENRV